jgi:hypothetical protein
MTQNQCLRFKLHLMPFALDSEALQQGAPVQTEFVIRPRDQAVALVQK